MITENWGAEPGRAPDIQPGDEIIFDECGRVLGSTDYRSHWFRLVKDQYGSPYMLVKHGAGQERIKVGWSKRLYSALAGMDSDSRYFMLHTLYRMRTDALREASTETAREYRAAFVEGRLRKRKLPSKGTHKVWIEAR